MNPLAAMFAVTLMLCSACVAATEERTTQVNDDGDQPSTAEAPAGVAEQLIAQPPKGWRRIGTTNVGNLRRAEYIPDDELEDAWTRRITFESMQEDPLPDPIEFIELKFRQGLRLRHLPLVPDVLRAGERLPHLRVSTCLSPGPGHRALRSEHDQDDTG